jgi:hypothetical protein
VKEKDWLKSYEDKMLRAANSGRIKLCASCEVIHELYSIKLGIDMETLLNKIAALTSINMQQLLRSL